MSQQINIKWDWGDTKVHPAIRYPSSWVDEAPACLAHLPSEYPVRFHGVTA